MKLSRLLIVLPVALYLFQGVATAQKKSSSPQQQDTLAVINGKPILSGEFEERYKLTPRIIAPGDKEEKKSRFEFLLALIAEKLLAEDAAGTGIEKNVLVKNGYGSMEKLFFRDALWKEKMESNLVIDDKEIIQEFIKLRSLVLVNFLYSPDSTEIKSLYSRLQKGIPFDTLLKDRSEALMQDSSVIIESGKGERGAEDLIFALKDSGNFTQPYKNREGYFIFCLRFRGMKPLKSGDDEKLTALAKDNIRNKKIDERYAQYYREKLKGRKVETDRMLFDRFADKVITALKKQQDTATGPKAFSLKLSDRENMMREFGPDTLALHFYYIDGRPVLFGEFINDFFIDGFFSAYPDMVPLQLQARIKAMIEQEMAFREARNSGYVGNENVRKDITTWKGYYLAQGMIEAYKDSAANKGIEKELSKGRLVSLIELMTNDLDIIDKVLDSIRLGYSFKTLASRHSMRHWGSVPGAPSPLMPVTSFTGLSEAIKTLKKGELGGPYKTGEYYSLVKIIDEKKNAGLPGDSLSSRNAAAAEFLTEKTVDAANKYNLRIYEKNLEKITVKNAQAFIFRYIGFGGRIQAFPLTPPFIEWYAQWKNTQNPAP